MPTKALWQGLALILLPALALVGLEIYQVARNVPELRRNQDLVSHTIAVITTAQSLERAIQDAERGQRGFLITGNEAYLDPYRSTVPRIPIILSALKELTQDNPEQQRRWSDLGHQIDIKLAELKQTIDTRRTQGFDAARQIVETDVGLESMQAIDALIDAAIAGENNLLKQRQALGEAAERRAAIASIIAIVITVALMGAGGVLVTIGSRRLVRSDQELSASESRFRLMVSGIKELRNLSAGSGRSGRQLESRRRTHEGLPAGGNRRPAFLMLLPQ
jgi:CHASE3 domain sensor protein